MNNDWDQLRFFLALAQNKTLTRAGRSLQVSHSTVFRKLKSMEEELGVTLFENTSTGYSLTNAGRQLLEETQEVGDIIETSFRKLNGLDQRDTRKDRPCRNRIHGIQTFAKDFSKISREVS